MVYRDLPIEAFENALLQVDRIKAGRIFNNYYLENNSFKSLEYLIVAALENIGLGWEKGQFSLAQVYMGGVICEELIDKYMHRFNQTSDKDYKIGIGVLLDHHALGKRIVYSVLRSSGYEIIDFGHGLSVNELVEKTINKEIDCLIISTLMLPSALQVKSVVEELKELSSSVKVIAGGAPFRLDSGLWKRVKVDADGKNATDMPKIIEELIKGGNSNEFNGARNGNIKS